MQINENLTILAILLILLVLAMVGIGALGLVHWIVTRVSGRASATTDGHTAAAEQSGTLRLMVRVLMIGTLFVGPLVLLGLLALFTARVEVREAVATPAVGVQMGYGPSDSAPRELLRDSGDVQRGVSDALRQLRVVEQQIRQDAQRLRQQIVVPEVSGDAQGVVHVTPPASVAQGPSVGTQAVPGSDSVAAMMGASHPEFLVRLERLLAGQERVELTLAMLRMAVPGVHVSAAAAPLAEADHMQTLAGAVLAALIGGPHSSSTAIAAVTGTAESGTGTAGLPGTVTVADVAQTPAVPSGAAVAETAATVHPVATAASPAPLAERDDADAEPPNWLKHPDGGRMVVETSFVPAGEDMKQALQAALSDALVRHLQQNADTLLPTGNWDRLVQLQLSEAAVQQCVVDTYELAEVLDTREGPQTMSKTIALVEFPEAVDRAALGQIRRVLQLERISIVAVVTGLMWLAVLLLGLMIRWGRASASIGRRAVVAVTTLVLILPLVMVAVGVLRTSSEHQVFKFPWLSGGGQTVLVDASR